MSIEPLRVAYVELDPQADLNSAIFRLHLPAMALNKAGYKATVVREDEWLAEQLAASVVCADAHLIVMQRPWRIEHVLMMKKWLVRRKPIFIDIDDAYDRLDPGNAAYTFWNTVIMNDGRSLRRLDMLRDAMATATGITVASKRLEEDWRAQGRTNVGYFPNYLDVSSYVGVAQKALPSPGEAAVLGFGGTTSHIKGWKESGLLPALQRLARVRKDFRIHLHTPDERLAVSLAQAVGPYRMSWYKWMRPELWPKAMGEFDIALAPLSGVVDQRRSHLRVAEAMCLGIPWIGNNNGPYDEFDSFGTLIDQGARKWEAAITDALRDLEARKQLASRNRDAALIQFDIYARADEIAHGYSEMMG